MAMTSFSSAHHYPNAPKLRGVDDSSFNGYILEEGNPAESQITPIWNDQVSMSEINSTARN